MTVASNIILDKTNYSLGEEVHITISNSTSSKLFINHKENTFTYLGSLNDTITYVPEEKGWYTLYLEEEEVNNNVSFFVHATTNNTEIITTDKKSYFLGETVSIYLLEHAENIIVSHNGTEFKFLNSTENTIIFNPFTIGDYTVSATIDNEQAFATFQVIAGTTITTTSPLLKQSSSKKYFSLDEYPFFTFIASELASPSISAVNIKKINEQRVEIDQTLFEGRLNSPEAQMSERISISTNSNDETITFSISPHRNIQPGEYTLEIFTTGSNGETIIIEEEFYWGLVSLNTKKSIYKPRETAEFEIVVLNAQGHGICNANISLAVSTPSGGVNILNTDQGAIQAGELCGLYYSRYPTAEEGTHSIDVTVFMEDNDGQNLFFETAFLVQQEYRYDILRDAQSMIDPTINNSFDVSITINSLEGSESLAITEYVPTVFQIFDTNAQITEENGSKVLRWNLQGDQATVQYSYSVPLIWPYLYQLGPLNVNGFNEFRPWYVAVDPAVEEDTDPSYDVAIAALDQTRVVVAWVDAAENDISFRIHHTNGTNFTSAIDVDTTVDSNSRVSVAPINTSVFIISWYDGVNEDVNYSLYYTNGTHHSGSGVVGAETAVGSPAVDVSITTMQNTFQFCYVDDAESDPDVLTINSSVLGAGSETTLDSNIGPDLALQNLIECAAINDTRFVAGFFDDQQSFITYEVLAQDASSVGIDDQSVDTAPGDDAHVAVTALNQDRFAIAWYDSTGADDDTIELSIIDVDNNNILSATSIDANAGTTSRVALATIRNSSESSDSVLAAWNDRDAGDIRAVVYNGSGTLTAGPYQLVDDENTTSLLFDVYGKDSLAEIGVCDDAYLLAYTNTSGSVLMRTFYINGTDTDGFCTPTISVNLPSNGSTLTDVTPTLNVTLDRSVDTLWYTPDSGATNITMCNDCASIQFVYGHLPEGSHTVRFYANDSTNRETTNVTTFEIDLNLNYTDDFNDNSSLNIVNDVTWEHGNISFYAGNGTYSVAGFGDNQSEIFETDGSGAPHNFLMVGPFNSTTDWNFDPCGPNVQPPLNNCNGVNITVGNFSQGDACNGQNWSNQNNADTWPFLWDLDDDYFTGDPETTYGYMQVYVWSEANDTDVRIRYDKDDTMFLYVNDVEQTLSDATTCEGVTEDENDVDINFTAGWNKITFSVAEDGGGYGFYWRFSDTSDNVKGFNYTTSEPQEKQTGNFTVYSANTSANITEIVNISWTETGTDTSNTLTIQASTNNGDSWFNATNAANLETAEGNALIYRALFSADGGNVISIRDINITLNNASVTAPQISVNTPSNGSTLADVTPTLNVTLSKTVDALWYSLNNGLDNYTVCNTCGDTQTEFIHVAEGSYTIHVYANDTSNRIGANSTGVTIDMNSNYFDSFDDNSSLDTSNNVTWTVGSVSFTGSSSTYRHALIDENTSEIFETDSSGAPHNFLMVGPFNSTTDWDFDACDPGGIQPPLNNCNGVNITVGNFSQGDACNGQNWSNQNNADTWPFVWDLDDDYFTGDPSTTYGYFQMYVWSEINDTDVRIRYDKDDTMFLYVNDAEVTLSDATTCEGAAADENDVDITLLAGWNKFTWSVGEDGGQYGLYWRFSDTSDNVKGFNYTTSEPAGTGAPFGNFTSKTINVSQTVTEFTNITWTENNTNVTNNITVLISADNGANWYSANNGEALTDITEGGVIIYNVRFDAEPNKTIHLLDMNISWSNSTIAAPQITVNGPTSGSTLADVTPTLNVTLDKQVTELWYTPDGSVTNITICNDCASTQIAYAHLTEGSHTITFFANDSANRQGSNSTSFTIDMDFNFYDTFIDNSSQSSMNSVSWQDGNLTFDTGFGTYGTAGFGDNQSEIFETDSSGAPHNFLMVGAFNSTTDWNFDPCSPDVQPPLNNCNGVNITVGNFSQGDACNGQNWSNQNNADTWPFVWDLDNDYFVGDPQTTYGYLQIYVWSEAIDTDVRIRYDKDDTMFLYVNDVEQTLSDATTCEGASADENDVDINFTAGWNKITFSVAEDGGGYGFYWRFSDTSNSVKGFNYTTSQPEGPATTHGNFTIHSVNTTLTIPAIVNITWTENGTDTNHNLTIQVSADNGANWTNATNGQGISEANIQNGNALVYRALFNGNAPSRLITLLDVNITWSSQAIIINYPQNITYNETVTQLNYTLSSAFTFSSCSYTLDGGVTNTTITCGNNVTGLSADEGSNTWTVYAVDNESVERSDTVTFSVDTLLPVITLNAPSPNASLDSRSVLFNWTVTDNVDTELTCNLTLDSVDQITNFGVTNGTATTRAVNELEEGTHFWNVTCHDDFAHFNISETRNFTIDITTNLLRVVKGEGATTGANHNITLPTALSNISKAFHFISYRHVSQSHSDIFKSSEILNATTLGIYGGGTTPVNYSYVIYEFDSTSPIFVQRELLNFSANPTVPINSTFTNAVNTTSSFILQQGHAHYGSDSAIGTEEYDRVRLVNATTWEFQVGNNPDTGPQEVRVEIIDFDDEDFIKSVQRGITSVGSASTSASVTPTTAVNANNTLIFSSMYISSGGALNEPPSEVALFSTLTPSGTINLQRQVSGPTLSVAWQAVEFQSGIVDVQHINISYASGTDTNTTTIEAVVVNRSAAIGTVSVPFGYSTGQAGSTTNNAIDRAMFTINLTNGTNVQAIRSDSTGTAEIGIQIWQILAGPTISNVNATGITSSTANITWDTDSSANSTVLYGTNLNLTSSANNASLVLSHVITLTSLTANTTYFFNVTSCNSLGCSSDGVYNFTTTIVGGSPAAPILNLSSPANNSFHNVSTLLLVYNISDINLDIANATLIINGARNISNQSAIVNNDANNFSITFPDGSYNWSVNATDDGNLEGATNDTWIFTIDTAQPQITLLNPTDDESISQSTFNFSVIATDNLDGNLTCDLIVDSTVFEDDFDALNGTAVNITETISVGDHLWNVTCFDDSGNYNTSATFNFSVTDAPPTVTLNTTNDTTVGIGNITLFYNATDNNGFTITSLIINGEINRSNVTAILNGQLNNFTLVDFPEGVYNWTVNVTDTGGFNATATPSRVFTIDLTEPGIVLNLPGNDSESNTSTLGFNFTATDNFDASITCSLFVENQSDLNFSATSGSLTNRDISGLTDGLKYWNVTCFDNAGNLNTSAVRVVNISEVPQVELNVTNNSFFNFPGIDLHYVPSDNTNLSVCNLYIDDTFNRTNESMLLVGAQNTFSMTFDSGVYNWFTNCTDLNNLNNQSETRTLTVDLIAPTIDLLVPDDNATLFTSTVTFNFTTIDNIDTNMTCNLTVDSINESSNFDALNATNTSVNVNFATGGTKFWNVTCHDDAGNFNTSATRNFTLSFAPVVTLSAPADENFNNTATVLFFYDVTDDNDNIANATIIINGARNNSNSSTIVNADTNNITVTLEDGVYTWTVNVTDDTNLEGTDVNFRTITIDTVAPNITQHTPPNNSYETWNNITFNFTVTDAIDNNLTCDLYLNNTLLFGNINASDNVSNVFYSVHPDGFYEWNVSCVDNATNIGVSHLFNFTIEAPPNVTLISPNDTYVSNVSDITFTYLPDDAIGITNCSLYFNDNINNTNTEVDVGSNNNFEILGLADGTYNWTVACIDASPDFNEYRAPARNITVDTTDPASITLNAPADNANTTEDVTFNFTAIDNVDLNISCNLTIDSVVNVSYINATNGTQTILNVDDIPIGTHLWNVTCWDDANNLNTSETFTFTISLVDLEINTTDITFNVSAPQEGENVLITANISNLGSQNADNVVVQFYEEDPNQTGTQIGNNQSINVTGFQSVLVNVSWVADIGTSRMFVFVDPPVETNGSITEDNESNNEANRTIEIGSWNFVYGNFTQGDFLLDDSTNRSLFTWNTTDENNSNLFVADLDSSVDFSSLNALGKTTSQANDLDDFAEVDGMLNLSNFTDSVVTLYSVSGLARNATNYTIFKEITLNVPIADSITNTNFSTGILWDTSDDSGNNEFDVTDREDLVFITTMHSGIGGTYSVVDYEIRVPATLRTYTGSEHFGVAFYVELK